MALSPVWLRAPGRAWRRGGSGPLVLAALLAAATSAASAPLFVQLSGDDALAQVRAAIPPTARTADSDDVRIVSGRSPTQEGGQGVAVARLARIPGMSAPATVAFSVAPEIRFSEYPRPVVRLGRTDVRARLTAVDDPATDLVPVSSTGATGGVWLPAPVAQQLGAEAGDTVELLVVIHDALHPLPEGAPPDPVARVVVDGIYDVGSDGRRPADPSGTTRWSRRVGGIPSDTEFLSLPSYLVVTDVRTAERIAGVTKDDLLWTTEASMLPGLTLPEAERTAAGVAAIREEVRAPSDERPGPLRTGLVSGVEKVVASAVALRGATAERVRLLSLAGTVVGLVVLLVVVGLMGADRRTELRHGAAVGIGPVRTAGTWVLEALLPAVLAVVGGVGLAYAAMAAVGPEGAVRPETLVDAARAAGVVGLVGLAIVGVSAALMLLRADRPDPDGRRRQVPWAWLVGVAAVTSVVSVVTAPSAQPGPVALLTPVLVGFAVGALVAGIVVRLSRSRRAHLPSTARSAGRWLGRRRVAGGGTWVLPVAALSLGLGLVMVTATAVTATRVAMADRVAVRSGAESAVQIQGTWQLDPLAPQAPTARDVNEGKPIPKPRQVRPPSATSVVWRTLVSVEGDFGYHDAMIVDPVGFAGVASWGEGVYLAQSRALLPLLGAPLPTGLPSGAVPAIAVNDASVRVGQLVAVSAQGWQAPVYVVAKTDAFPGLGSRPLLVTTDRLMAYWGRSDPRLAPPEDTIPLAYSETWLWSAQPSADVVRAAERRGATVLALTTPDELALDPLLDAAGRSLGYLVALAAVVALACVVVVAEQARRGARQARAADAMLARVGLGAAGVGSARRWETGGAVLTGLVAAVVATFVVTPIGAALFDLDRAARPSFEYRLSWQAVVATVATAVVAFLLALWAGGRGSRSAGAEERVLRDG